MKLKEETAARLKWLLTIVITTLGVYIGFKYFLPLILPFLFAYFLAWVIRPTTEFLYRKLKIPRIVGGTASLLILVTLLGAGIYYLCNTLIKQIILFVRNIPIYLNIIADKLDHICNGCDELFGLADGYVRSFVDDNIDVTILRLKNNVMPRMTEKTISFTIGMIGFVGVLLIVLVAAVLIAKDLPVFNERYKENSLYRDIHKVTMKLTDAGIAYLRTQIIILSIIGVISVIGLMILKNEYAVLIGIGIAIMDALPILGSGLVYIPWSIIMLFSGNIYSAAILMTTFLVCQIIREILEPKLIGNRIGVKPLFTLIAMYIGVKLFAIAGFILGPIGLIIIITIVKTVNEKTDSSVVDHGKSA
jgi:sporulation integral membrane protein YtvI